MRAIVRRTGVLFLAAVMTVVATGRAGAAVTSATSTNVADGDNRSTTGQHGSGASADAVGGQVTGVVSGGRASVDATNDSRNSTVGSGAVGGTNKAKTFTGLQADSSDGSGAGNLQIGNDTATFTQTANASSGDAVGGQIVGSVTSPGGSSSIAVSNTTDGAFVTTGDAVSLNANDAFVGDDALVSASSNSAATSRNIASCTNVFAVCTPIQTNVFAVSATSTVRNTQTGSNRATVSQSAPSSTGDGVAGQIVGAVTSAGGSSSIVATNASQSVDVRTGDAVSTNTSGAFAGLSGRASSVAGSGAVTQTNTTSCYAVFQRCAPSQGNALRVTSASAATNTQTGDNRVAASQSAPASTGDGVAGQVVGVASAGRSSIDATNRSTDVTVDTGDATSANSANTFAGPKAAATSAATAGAVTQTNDSSCGLLDYCIAVQNNTFTVASMSDATNNQSGDNRASVSQAAPASSGDAVGGQVVGAVTSAAGSSSIVAANTSKSVDVSTGDAVSTNASDASAGPYTAAGSAAGSGGAAQSNGSACSIAGSCGPSQTNAVRVSTTSMSTNTQAGADRVVAFQSGPASTGDGVAGQVVGAVTNGRSSIDARNISTDSTVLTGDASSAGASEAAAGPRGDAASSSTDLATLGQANTSACRSVSACVPVQRSLAGVAAASAATSTQTGDDRTAVSQSAPASTGDGVAGQVIGAVTSAGGSSSVALANTSATVDVATGVADATNEVRAFAGPGDVVSAVSTNSGSIIQANSSSCTVVGLCAPIQTNAVPVGSTSAAANAQIGDDRITDAQSAPASTGDGVAGQVVGSVAAGRSEVDARNTSADSTVQTGDATTANTAGVVAGLRAGASSSADTTARVTQTNDSTCQFVFVTPCTPVQPNSVSGPAATSTATNSQNGDDRAAVVQSAFASTGDGVAGQVIGAVTSAGGSSSIVAANTSRTDDVSTGEARSSNGLEAFAGLRAGATSAAVTSDDVTQANSSTCAFLFSGTCAPVQGNSASGAVLVSAPVNVQTGSNRVLSSQSADASSGDAVAGQVIGVVGVAGGAASVVSDNVSTDVDAESGQGVFGNSQALFVGLTAGTSTVIR